VGGGGAAARGGNEFFRSPPAFITLHSLISPARGTRALVPLTTHTQRAPHPPPPPPGLVAHRGKQPSPPRFTQVNWEESFLPTMPDRVAELETQLATLQAEVRGRQGGAGTRRTHAKTRPDSPSRAGIAATSLTATCPHPSPLPHFFRLKRLPSTQSARRRCVWARKGAGEKGMQWGHRALAPPPQPSPHTPPRGAAAPAWRGRLAGCALQAGNGVWARTAAPTAAAPP